MRNALKRHLEGKTPVEKRWFFARIGLIALAVLVFVIVPGYLSSRPAFMERYPGYETAYLTWDDSLHSHVSCQTCHVPPGVVPQTAYATRMLAEFYVSLALPAHTPDLIRTPVNDACYRCHMELRVVSPSGDLLIPHRAHVEMLGMECVECHDYLIHEASPEGSHTPPMSECLTCHDGEVAKSDCAACHTDKDQPETHAGEDWLITHAVAELDEDCRGCHDWTPDWCADCHAERPDSHGEDWRAQHRNVVAERRNCEACHEGPFCVRCHGEVPLTNFDPGLELVR